MRKINNTDYNIVTSVQSKTETKIKLNFKTHFWQDLDIISLFLSWLLKF